MEVRYCNIVRRLPTPKRQNKGALLTLGQLGTITYIYALYFISLEKKINVTLETFHFYVFAALG